MHEIGYKLKFLTFFLNFDLAKGGGGVQPPLPPRLHPWMVVLPNLFRGWGFGEIMQRLQGLGQRSKIEVVPEPQM